MNSLLAAPVVALLVSSSAPLPSVLEGLATSEARLSNSAQIEAEEVSEAPGSLQQGAQEGEALQAPVSGGEAPQGLAEKGAAQAMDLTQGASGMVALDGKLEGASSMPGLSPMVAADDLLGGASPMVSRDFPGGAGAVPMGAWMTGGARGMMHW
jgi:hypothetical protein